MYAEIKKENPWKGRKIREKKSGKGREFYWMAKDQRDNNTKKIAYQRTQMFLLGNSIAFNSTWICLNWIRKPQK